MFSGGTLSPPQTRRCGLAFCHSGLRAGIHFLFINRKSSINLSTSSTVSILSTLRVASACPAIALATAEALAKTDRQFIRRLRLCLFLKSQISNPPIHSACRVVAKRRRVRARPWKSVCVRVCVIPASEPESSILSESSYTSDMSEMSDFSRLPSCFSDIL
jgi:hypothetical protein